MSILHELPFCGRGRINRKVASRLRRDQQSWGIFHAGLQWVRRATWIICLITVVAAAVLGQQADPVVTCTEPELEMTAWTVSAYCTGIMRGNASQDNCYWNLYKDKRSWVILTSISHQVKQVSKETFLWNCSLHHQLPYDNTTYEVYIQFRSQTNVEKHALAFSFRYVPPSLELSCPAHVNEGDPFNCTCRVSNKPLPCPQVSWDDSALSQQVCAGETTHLSYDSVKRAQNGQHHACHTRWLNLTISRSYQVTVAYRPDEVTASRKDLAMARRSSPVLLTCVASDFFPAVRFTWNVTCVNITTTDNSSECLLQLTQEDDGKTFRCNVSSVISEVSQHGDYTFNMKDTCTSGLGCMASALVSALLKLVLTAVVMAMPRRYTSLLVPLVELP